jgi:SNF2 family DNA or RNA helicase
MSFFGKVIQSIGRRLVGASAAGQVEPMATSSVDLLDRPAPVESMGQGGLAFPPTSVAAPATFFIPQANAIESEPLLTSWLEGGNSINWSEIDAGNLPQKVGFRTMTDPVEVDGFSLDSPDDLPVRWRLLLPALQVSLDVTWSNELDFPDGCQPYSYQWEGIKALAESDGFLLADDMGTGKTIQALLAARLLFQKGLVKTMLVVAPISVLSQWQRESARWARVLLVDLVRGSPDERKALWLNPAHVKLTAYETLRQDQDWLEQKQALKYDLVVLDEAQRIKNPGTATAQAVKLVVAGRRWGLSGTPLENRLEEVRAICSYIRPGLLKTATLTPQRVKSLLKPYLLRRRKEEVLKDLPPKEEFEIWLKMGDAQQKAYDEMEKERVLELSKSEVITAQNILTLILELKKICNRDPRSGDSIKGEWLEENLDDIAGAGHKALIFTQFRQPQFGGSEWIADELQMFQPMNYAEADSDKLREHYLSEFESDPERKVFIGHPRTAGLGLNQLVVANYVIHFDHWWNPAITNQATARAHRPRQNKKVFVYHLWVEGTIEEMILNKLRSKQALFDETIDSLATFNSEEILFGVYKDLLRKYDIKAKSDRLPGHPLA